MFWKKINKYYTVSIYIVILVDPLDSKKVDKIYLFIHIMKLMNPTINEWINWTTDELLDKLSPWNLILIFLYV